MFVTYIQVVNGEHNNLSWAKQPKKSPRVKTSVHRANVPCQYAKAQLHLVCTWIGMINWKSYNFKGRLMQISVS